MKMYRKSESPDERKERLAREAHAKKADAALNEAKIDRMIERNVEEFGP
jgi:hypothetical protein